MKQILVIIAMFSLATQLVYSQERTDYKKERKLVRVTSYHDNGKLAQKGYLKSNKLHGEWISYSSEGDKLTQGSFEAGKKEGKWIFWQTDQITEVIFKNNLAIDKVVWERETLATTD